jgi:4'-phosphopantetheinyl transferase
MSPIDVYWLEQHEADLPAENDWLGSNELARLSTLRFPKRRADWLLGRWTAKLAVSAYLEMCSQREALRAIEIRPAESGAPLVFIDNQPAAISISISHCHGVAFCAVGPPNTKLGCDLELIEEHSEAFVLDYFTQEEQHAIRATFGEERQRIVSLMWSAKESALKALSVGLRTDTRSVAVCLGDKSAAGVSWSALRVHVNDGRTFEGWWNQSGRLIRTIVAPSVQSPCARAFSMK